MSKKGIKQPLKRRQPAIAFRLFIAPYLFTGVVFSGLYSLINYTWGMQSGFRYFPKEPAMFWLPFLLPFGLLLPWLWKRLTLIGFNHENGVFGIFFLGALGIAIPCIMLQSYLIKATGRLTTLSDIDNYTANAASRYYSLHDYFLDASKAGKQFSAKVSGKHNRDLVYTIWYAAPLYSKATDTARPDCTYWIAWHYRTTISNSLSTEAKTAHKRQFEARCATDFAMDAQNRIVYLEQMDFSGERTLAEAAIMQSPVVRYQDPVVFTPNYAPFEYRNGRQLNYTITAWTIANLLWTLIFLWIALPKNIQAAARKQSSKPWYVAFGWLVPKPWLLATTLLVYIMVFVFTAMVISSGSVAHFSSQTLSQWGGNNGTLTSGGQWWRLVTALCIHGGLEHLANNVISLLVAGVVAEPILGRKGLIFIFIASGIGGGIITLWWHHAQILAVGASGGIFGLAGALLMLTLRLPALASMGKWLWAGITVYIAFNLVIGYLTPMADNAGHIGGLLSGMLLGWFAGNTIRKRNAASA